MAGMKRFVTYIYSYENREKGNNVGFAKIEIRGEECRMELHLRGLSGNTNARVALFRVLEGGMQGFPLGELIVAGGAADFRTMFRAGKLCESSYSIYDMEGIILFCEDERIFMSRWSEGEAVTVDKEHYKLWEKPATEQAEKEKQQGEPPQNVVSETMTEQNPTLDGQGRAANYQSVSRQTEATNQRTEANPSVGVQQQTGANPSVGSNQRTEANPSVGVHQPTGANPSGMANQRAEVNTSEGIHERAEANPSVGVNQPTQANRLRDSNEPAQENVAATEIPMRNIFPQYTWEEIWDSLKTNHAMYTPFADEGIACLRIELKDIRSLPRRYWYLGNNSFLLHGFFNYHYLIIGRKAEHYFLGIPGIFQHQERVMATIFGFPEFIPTVLQADGRETAKEEQQNTEPLNRFGFWFRYIDE